MLLQPLLRDEDPYVRRNLGPSAIGDVLLRVDPKETLKALREWSSDRDQFVRWNVAMAFASGIGSFHWPVAKSILERLAKGTEPLVRGAVAKAMRRCRQRYTEEVEETRLRWLKDRDRAPTAQLVGPHKEALAATRSVDSSIDGCRDRLLRRHIACRGCRSAQRGRRSD